LVFSVCRRNRLLELMAIIGRIDRSAIVTVQEVRTQVHGFFSRKRPSPPTAARSTALGMP
jgi:uncharacterized membrane-anchored protein YitT (DUF2179 family)